ncbi:MAG: 16S rRNA (cytosine(1402)-N(4))-methyltransferase [Deltaproteobacteria bacterium RIFCSPLOWO2_12_FULL_50_11]|nr:MAG: 16S rRNA (cytosine(1402)-N(4))-methyltransferase [Deltaproteobacteria bacterium RIFCSPHIGHO2_02_FULL_50_15]OGQ66781.1 MAG: 16S rRNA (cytosine(1402)-N(4))-methyltransferase [Deltaproteobacteria bacterium RIFCSPLOWO2_12_FULL_50_11]
MKTELLHCPVLVNEILNGLLVEAGKIYWDGTLGTGGHAEAILQRSSPSGQLIGSDQDEEAIAKSCNRLIPYKERLQIACINFNQPDEVLKINRGIGVDGVLLDLGVSMLQLKQPCRGFSFLTDERLDMRMNQKKKLTAHEIVNTWSEDQLRTIFQEYGEERKARKIAEKICWARQKKSIETTRELASLIIAAMRPMKSFSKIHPATRVFQALRISVNQEISALQSFLENCLRVVKRGGRIAIISYHSLEDRLVKQTFRRYAIQGNGKLVFKKPIIPTFEERQRNPHSRSAKLRIFERSL